MHFFKNLLEKRSLSLFLILTLLVTIIPFGMAIVFPVRAEIDTGYLATDFGTLFDHTNQFIVVKHKQLGGSHYAYTDGLSDEVDSPEGNEVNFNPGSQMVLVTLEETTTTSGSCNNTTSTTSVKSTEEELLASSSGVIRDPDVSEDGTKVLFSWKKESSDDFHLYEMNIATKEYTQLTFGSGIADVEPKYLPNGKIVFQSTRCISNVDCWKIAVMNTFICDGDGSNIIRVGYDQVHTTYPTVTEDGRILYTRWDYNDRNQMYVQSVFQMFPDGTNQTEVYGNNSNFPTTLLHTREVPGSTGLYVSISSGHHTAQRGRIVLVDTNLGRNGAEAISYPFEEGSWAESEDTQNQSAPFYKYPVALNDHEFLVSYNANDSQEYGIYYMNSETGLKICISEYNSTYGCGASQIAMIKTREMFERPSMVNQSVEYGTYYMGNVYQGGGLEGVEFGAAKYLRVVEIEYRPYAIGATQGVGTGSSDPYTPVSTGNGAWDIKRVLGLVEIEEDGSALFRIPANTPIYFQVLNEEGELIQSMRSWSTLMSNETFSCVGCHEDKNTVPPYQSTTTMAMKKGVQELQPDFWMPDYAEGEYDIEEDTKGFSYPEMVQPILDANCISCHNDQDSSFSMIGGSSSGTDSETENNSLPLVELGSDFSYTTTVQSGDAWRTSSIASLQNWNSGSAPFGTDTIQEHAPNTYLDVVDKAANLYLRKDFTLASAVYNNLALYDVYLNIAYDENPEIYLNGTQIYSASGYVTAYQEINITDAFVAAAVSGENKLAVSDINTAGGMFIDFSITLVPKGAITLVEKGSSYKYTTTVQSNTNWTNASFSTSGWSTGNAPFGTGSIDGTGINTDWTSSNIYIRSSFSITEELKKAIEDGSYAVYMDIAWDEEPHIYLNGTEILSRTGYTTTYTEIEITKAFSDAVIAGTNTLAASAVNTGGGQFLDFNIRLVPQTAKLVLMESAGSFQYTTTEQSNVDWTKEGYSASGWGTGNAPFGTGSIDGTEINTDWTSANLYVRSTFEVSQEVYDKVQSGEYAVYFNIAWDESPVFYLNGTKILTRTGYTTAYQDVKVTTKFKTAVKVGTNTIAVSAENTGGGQFLDFSIYLEPINPINMGSAFSLEGVAVEGPREEMFYSLSYLVLTNSTLSGSNYIGNSVNDFTNWISSMSQCEMLEPYQFGSTQSNIITMLKTGHGGTSLTEKEIDTITAWIDLGVPYRGAYTESPDWDNNDYREATEKQNKRDYYDALDETTKRILGGKEDTDKLPITITYSGNSTSVTENGMAILYPGTSYASGANVTVTLPEGVEYFFFALDSRIGEALIYAPSGTYTYTIPSDAANYFPATFSSAVSPTISARIATDEELTETRNLARNPYDISGNSASATSYPHVNASTQYNASEFDARNAIDGFAVNNGHGTYPLQSWGTAEGATNSWYNVNFGREVCVDSVAIAVRADWSGGHDTYYTSAVLEFSDGSTQNITLVKDSDMQVFEIEGGTKVTSYVKIKNMETAGSEWAGLSEVEVYGSVYEEGTVPLVNISMPDAYTLDVGVKKQIPLTYLPGDATVESVEWSSSNASVATVDENGVVFAVGAGSATITVTVDGLTATCQITAIKSAAGVTVYDYETGETITVYYPDGEMNLGDLKKDKDYLYITWYDKPESATNESVITSAAAGTDIYLQRIPIDEPISSGKSIRVADNGTNGIRFKATINREAFYAYFNGQEDYVYSSENDFTFGMLLLPKRILGENELTLETPMAKNIVGRNVYKQQNNDGDLEFTGVLIGIPEASYDWDIAARAYITFEYEGETYTIYSEETAVGSYQEVATLVYNDPDVDQSIKDALEEIFGDALLN